MQPDSVSSSSQSPGSSFWWLCLSVVDGEVLLEAAQPSSTVLFVFLSVSHWRTTLCSSWLHGSLAGSSGGRPQLLRGVGLPWDPCR